MAHEKLNINVAREWSRTQAKNEPNTGITSVGGLAHRVSELTAANAPGSFARADYIQSTDPRRLSLGKFVELSRRRLRLSVEQLADKANVELVELLALEKAEDITPEARTIFQLAGVLNVRPEPLMELAGLVIPKTAALTDSAVRFAARSEPMQALSSDEEAALNWFVKELTKS